MSLLRVDGAVRTPRTFDGDALRALPAQVDDVGTLVRGRVGGAVRLAAVLDAVGVLDDARSVALVSADGHFTQSAPLASLRDALLVYRLGDGSLPADDGGPIRFLVPDAPGLVGVDRCTNVKALATITVRREPA